MTLTQFSRPAIMIFEGDGFEGKVVLATKEVEDTVAVGLANVVS